MLFFNYLCYNIFKEKDSDKMVSGGNVNADGSSISKLLNSCQEQIEGLSDSWKGASFENASANSSAFVAEYNAIVDQMSRFASACDLYSGSYLESKRSNASCEKNVAEARANNLPDDVDYWSGEVNKYQNQMNSLKGQIEAMLSEVRATKLTATPNNAKVSGASSSSNLSSFSSVAAADSAIEVHSRISDSDREARINAIGGENQSNMVDIKVPYWNGEQEDKMVLTVNENLVTNYQNVFRELTDMKFTIKPEETSAHEYRMTVSGTRLSDHAYGSAIDINWNDNPYTKGPNPNNPSENPYVVTEEVVQAFAKQGFYWGGDWQSTQDYMHFSWTGR